MKMHEWTKSSYSGGQPDHIECVELNAQGATTLVRDSKHVEKGSLSFPAGAMDDFLKFARSL